MNGYILKLIAILTMLIDHIAAVFLPYGTPVYTICKSIGRLAFPLFCFLLVEGFLHTHDVKKYMLRLGIFAVISEVPFDLAFYKNALYIYHQNIFFTLLIGLAVIMYLNRIEVKYLATSRLLYNVYSTLVILAGFMIAMFTAVDYSFMGVLMIIAFYNYRKNKFLLTAVLLFVNMLFGGNTQIFAVLSMVFIWHYNGERGPQGNKYLFYIFYPAHLLVLYGLSLLPVF